MIRRRHRMLASLYVAFDAVVSGLALIAAWFFRFAVEVIPVTKGTQDIGVYLRILPLVVLVFPLVFATQGLYRLHPARSRSEEWAAVGVGTGIGTLLLSGLLLWVRPEDQVMYSRATLAIFMICEAVFVLGGRTVVRGVVEARFRAGRGLARVLVVGSGELARALVARMGSHRELGFSIIGFASNDSAAEIEGLERLGPLSDVIRIVRDRDVDHVYVALPQDSSREMLEILDGLIREVVSIHVVPDLLQFMALRSRVEDLDGLPTINLSETPLEGWNRIVKRSFDVLVGFALLVVVSPIIAAIAILVRMESRGPAFYRQTRMGLDGVPFEMIKFRSMRADAEESTGAVWASPDDPRRTRLGAILRKTSLDELPQIWNVLKGDMSLVGPRPERPEFVAQFRSEYPHYMLRHKVRAGMTGWAQVHGWRGNTSIRMRIEHDLYYIENWSILLDVKILLMTLRHGFHHENAY